MVKVCLNIHICPIIRYGGSTSFYPCVVNFVSFWLALQDIDRLPLSGRFLVLFPVRYVWVQGGIVLQLVFRFSLFWGLILGDAKCDRWRISYLGKKPFPGCLGVPQGCCKVESWRKKKSGIVAPKKNGIGYVSVWKRGPVLLFNRPMHTGVYVGCHEGCELFRSNRELVKMNFRSTL
jgi:hypothetical protein